MRERTRWLGWGLAALLGCAATGADATMIWSKYFTSVSDWSIIFDSSGNTATLTTNNTGQALFHVGAANANAAFGPIKTVSPLVLFDGANIAKYYMDFNVPTLTGSTSWDIGLDQFDANTNYLSTVTSVVPQTNFAGLGRVWLGGFGYDFVNTAFLLPKITVFTGNADQTVQFTSIDFDVVPEPSILALFVIGAGVVGYRRARTHSPPRAVAEREARR